MEKTISADSAEKKIVEHSILSEQMPRYYPPMSAAQKKRLLARSGIAGLLSDRLSGPAAIVRYVDAAKVPAALPIIRPSFWVNKPHEGPDRITCDMREVQFSDGITRIICDSNECPDSMLPKDVYRLNTIRNRYDVIGRYHTTETRSTQRLNSRTGKFEGTPSVKTYVFTSNGGGSRRRVRKSRRLSRRRRGGSRMPDDQNPRPLPPIPIAEVDLQRMYPLPSTRLEALDILGLHHDATAAEITREYVALRARLHPDMRQVNIRTGIGLPLSEAHYHARYQPIERAYALLLP